MPVKRLPQPVLRQLSGVPRSDDCRYDYEHVPIAGAVNEVCPMGFPGGMSFSFWEDKVRAAQHQLLQRQSRRKPVPWR